MPNDISELAQQSLSSAQSAIDSLNSAFEKSYILVNDRILLEAEKLNKKREQLAAAYFQKEAEKEYNQYVSLQKKKEKLKEIALKSQDADAVKEAEKDLKRSQDLQIKMNDYRNKSTKLALESEIRLELDSYKKLSVAKKRERLKEQEEKLKEYKKSREAEQEFDLQIEGTTAKGKSKVYARYASELNSIDKAIASREKTSKPKGYSWNDIVDIRTKRVSDLSSDISETKKQLALAETDEEKSELQAQLREQSKERSVQEAQLLLMKSIANAVHNISQKFDQSVEAAMENISKYMPVMDARLQGTNKDFTSLQALVRRNLAVSPFVKQVDVLENLSKLVHAGIVRDLEQRAFLATVSDKISDTFNVLNATLTQVVRLQQSDSTAARLGMREGLTEFFNQQFLDSSYMNDMYDTVSGAIIEANALLSRDESVAFEYAVQKWLGSLYSLGASQSFIGEIAKGINYLATGDVQGLASSTSLQNLFAMSAARSGGKGYAEMLKDGLNASDINSLMSSMVKYLQEIAEGSSSNRVVKSAFGDVFGVAMADFTSATNLKNLQSIIENNWDYNKALSNLQSQVGGIAGRTSISNMIENAFANAFYTMGSHIAESPALYTLWKVADFIENAGGIHLPAVEVFGNMVDLTAFTVEGIMKTGLMGVGALGLIGDIIGSVSSGGNLAFGSWGPVSGGSRGGNGLSKSSYVVSGSAEDIQSQTLTEQTESAEQTAQITNKNVKTEHTFEDLYVSMFEEQKPIQVVVTNSVGVTLDDIESTEKTAIIDYINEKVQSIVDATIASSFTLESGNSMAVTVINPEPVNVAITNQEIVDYYTQQALLVPPIEG